VDGTVGFRKKKDGKSFVFVTPVESN
jgi:hypothetical protein